MFLKCSKKAISSCWAVCTCSFLPVKLKNLLVISAGECYVQVLEENSMSFLEFTQSMVIRNISTLHQKCNMGSIYESIIGKDFTFPLSHQKVKIFFWCIDMYTIFFCLFFFFSKFPMNTQGTQILQLHKPMPDFGCLSRLQWPKFKSSKYLEGNELGWCLY